MLDRAPRLSRETEEYSKNIHIVADLTKKHRDMEAQKESNLARSHDEVSKNLLWKVVGRRGERMLRQYELQDNEEINREGRVVRRRD